MVHATLFRCHDPDGESGHQQVTHMKTIIIRDTGALTITGTPVRDGIMATTQDDMTGMIQNI